MNKAEGTQLQMGSRDLGQEANDPVNEQEAIMTQLDRKCMLVKKPS